MIFEPIDIRRIIKDVKNLMELKASGRNIDLLVEIHPGVPHVFWTEPRRMK
jgi:hypothetical protein